MKAGALMEQKIQILQRQKQQLSQKQLQSLQILAMDNLELQTFLQTEYLENPMLEQTGSGAENMPGTGIVQPADEDGKWNQRTEDKKDLREYLRSQLQIGSEDKLSIKIKEYLIDCIEDTGYFTMPLEEAARACGVSAKMASQCLEELRLLEPVGVFSVNLKECLLRQLQVLGIENPELIQIIEEHLENIAEGNIGRISRALHISTTQVRKYILMIEQLNPRPAAGFNNNPTGYIVPDIIIRKEQDWEILLNDGWMENYHISDYYLKLMSETQDEQLKEYFKGKARRVKFILQNVEQRRETLLKITKVILECQKRFLEGNGSLVPMTMSDVARSIGMHTSTVSRAVKGKYIQCPRETVLMKALFSQGVAGITMGEGEIGAHEIKQMIKEWIQKENRKKPYSDQKLKELLEKEGISISRRAVAKYREEMNIRASFERKE